MRPTPKPPSINPTAIHLGGQTVIFDGPRIQRMAQTGLSPIEYAILALVADAHQMSTSDLLAVALGEGKVER